MYRILSFLLILFIISTASAVGVGDEAPDFTLTKLGGSDFTLSDHRGKIVYIFWFSYN